MATATNNPPNLLSRREATRKKGQCQTCRTKVDLKDQFTVVNDLENGKVIKKKNAARRGAENLNHYCADCAEKRVKRGEYFIQRREDGTWGEPLNGGGSKSKAKAKKAPAKKKAAPKAKAKATPKKRVVKKAKATPKKKASKASSASDPF